ncbi:MAG: hypothetical protein LW850_03140 [Planctomycetaceae bacterium]|nr:hypothetical protein [Planctomycetaceae bacterium]
MNPKAFGWFSKLFLLIALACGLTTLQSIGLGQADDQATQAWLAKLTQGHSPQYLSGQFRLLVG